MKKSLSILLALVMVLSVFTIIPPLTANAESSGTTGSCTWELNDTVLTISGNGNMADYYFPGGPWGNNITEVIISDGVRSIGQQAFINSTNLTSVTIGNTVEKIRDGAFRGCSKLSSITIPDSVKSIGSVAFMGCTALKSATIPGSVQSFGDNVFDGCSGLKIYGYDNTQAKSYAAGYYNIEFVSLGPDPNMPEFDYDVIGRKAMITGYNGIGGDVTIPSMIDGYKVAYIGERAFSDCTGLTSVSIPNSVEDIYTGAFSGCIGLTSVTIPDSVNYISDRAFYGCTGLTDVSIPDSVTNIEYYSFGSCTGLTGVTLPESVESINSCAFYDCPNLTSITIPGSVTFIGDYAFGYYFDDDWNVTKVDDFTIYGYEGTIAESYAQTNEFTFVALNDEPAPEFEEYEEHTAEDYRYIVKADDTAEISEYIGTDSNVTTPTALDQHPVTRIRSYAFAEKAVKEVVISEGIMSIGYGAFNDCSELKRISISDTVNRIAMDAFSNCTELEDISLPKGVHCIEGYAFQGCTGLKSVQATDYLYSIGFNAFDNTAWYNSQPDGPVYIGKVLYAYKGDCPKSVSVREVTLGIAASAFSFQAGLEEISVPDSVISIGFGAFHGTAWYSRQEDKAIYMGKVLLGTKNEAQSIDLTIVDGTKGVSEGFTKFGAISSFIPKKSLKSAIIPDSVINIDDKAFNRETVLSDVKIGKSVKYIGKEAFIVCNSLEKVVIPASVEEIGEHAFGFDGSIAGEASFLKYNNDFTIYGYSGTEAERYAREYDFTFVSLDTFPKIGDTDGDGEIMITDATFIQREVANIPIPFTLDYKIADIDKDGYVTIMDATYIQRWLIDLESNDIIGNPMI